MLLKGIPIRKGRRMIVRKKTRITTEGRDDPIEFTLIVDQPEPGRFAIDFSELIGAIMSIAFQAHEYEPSTTEHFGKAELNFADTSDGRMIMLIDASEGMNEDDLERIKGRHRRH